MPLVSSEAPPSLMIERKFAMSPVTSSVRSALATLIDSSGIVPAARQIMKPPMSSTRMAGVVRARLVRAFSDAD